MAKRKRQRMFTREQRAANRAAVEAEARRIGRAEVERRADVALIEAASPGTSSSTLRLAEYRAFGEEDVPGMGEVDAAIERQFHRLTGERLTPDVAQRVLEEQEDRDEAAAEADYWKRYGGGF